MDFRRMLSEPIAYDKLEGFSEHGVTSDGKRSSFDIREPMRSNVTHDFAPPLVEIVDGKLVERADRCRICKGTSFTCRGEGKIDAEYVE